MLYTQPTTLPPAVVVVIYANPPAHTVELLAVGVIDVFTPTVTGVIVTLTAGVVSLLQVEGLYIMAR